MKNNTSAYSSLTSILWDLLEGNKGDLQRLHFTGPENILPSRFHVTAFASSAIGVATLALTELAKSRMKNLNEELMVEVDSISACAAFKSDSLFTPIGWQLPSPWDPFAGDYECKDGWIRLHTNYSYHRDAVFNVLGKSNTKEELALRVKTKEASTLEEEIHLAGGCSAVMYDRHSWQTHHHGKHTLNEKIITQIPLGQAMAKFDRLDNSDLPLKGIKILDMTRVIAGPTCTKFLSAFGADVLRIDPPLFEEVHALLPETTLGKKRTFLNLKNEEDKKIFIKLLKQSDVFVHGLRPDALDHLGFDLSVLQKINPSLIVASLNAYGSNGPWKNRRGFDSLIQMSSGIAEAGASLKKSAKPVPLPVQALDHATGYLMAASICRSLNELFLHQKINKITGSLLGASHLLQQFDSQIQSEVSNDFFDSTLVCDDTFWGPCKRVQFPALINGKRASWKIKAGPLGVDPFTF